MKNNAFLFPGQGSQYVGMGQSLCERYDIAEDVYRRASHLIGKDFKKICFSGPFELLSKTEYTQPAILTASIAAFEVFKYEINVKPDILLGFSFGELTALVVAETIEFLDALEIAKYKGELVEEEMKNLDSGMTMIECQDFDKIKKILFDIGDSKTVIGLINSPKQVVVSGKLSTIESIEKKLSEEKIYFNRLYISAPFHSPYLNEISLKVKKRLQEYSFKKPKYPVLSSCSGKIYKSEKEIAENLSMQLSRPINWPQLIEVLERMKIERAIEIGPKSVLTRLTNEMEKNIKVFSFTSPKDIGKIKKVFFL